MNDLFLFVRPPRPLWPYNGPDTSFWPPLAFASLAAALRQAVPSLRVQILDAPTLHLGWRTIESHLRQLRPRWIGIGEEAVSCVEGLRLARLARAVGSQIVAGGCFFSHVAPQILRSGLVDAVVHGEGEQTLVEFVQASLQSGGPALHHVPGLSFHDGSDIVFTGHRPLIPDLDRLPIPAWDLLPMDRYGTHSRNHPAFTSIELSRGCRNACSFCILWRQMGHFHGDQPQARLRTKSPERVLAEVRVLARQYGRRYLGWVDPCFNAHPTVPGQVAERLQRESLALGQSAWLRADALLRDEASGALAACIAAGLNEVYVGVERPDDAGLHTVNKGESLDQCRAAFDLLAHRYPQVYTIGTFLYGLPGDTPDTIRNIYQLSLDLPMDKAFFIPLTPLPGTPHWRPELWDDSGERFRAFSFLPASVVDSPMPELDRALLTAFALDWPPARLHGYWRGLTTGGPRKRRLTWRLFTRTTRHTATLLWQSATGQHDHHGMITPKWYET